MPRVQPIIAFLAACMLGFTSCRSPDAAPSGAPSEDQRRAVEKPWTKEAIEVHEVLWLQTSTGRQGYMTGPVLAVDDAGEFLTTKTDPTVHIALAEVIVMDALETEEAVDPASALGLVAGAFVGLFTAALYFLPAVAFYLLVA
jgi:hypothetical protein